MRADVAAAYLGIAVSTFHARVKEGWYPGPMEGVDDGRRIVLWDRHEIDRWLDSRSGEGRRFDIDEALEGYYGEAKDRSSAAGGRNR